jgi:hypothetical protein
METLPSPNMIPTSQHAGNTTADNSEAMTAPGSPSQSVPEDMIAPAPRLVPSAQIPVDNTREPVRYNPDAGVETR